MISRKPYIADRLNFCDILSRSNEISQILLMGSIVRFGKAENKAVGWGRMNDPDRPLRDTKSHVQLAKRYIPI